jgi:3D (Asp-Asp-Asp) domain-containing protein
MLPTYVATRWVTIALLLAVATDVSPAPEQPADEAAEPPANPETIYRVCRVTAYCDLGTTASGVPSGVGQCAAPIDIPFGSTIYIPDLDRTFVATDRTAKRFRHSTVDVFIPTREACLEFGCQYLLCEITLAED